jgi:hypothetical protein
VASEAEADGCHSDERFGTVGKAAEEGGGPLRTKVQDGSQDRIRKQAGADLGDAACGRQEASVAPTFTISHVMVDHVHYSEHRPQHWQLVEYLRTRTHDALAAEPAMEFEQGGARVMRE